MKKKGIEFLNSLTESSYQTPDGKRGWMTPRTLGIKSEDLDLSCDVFLSIDEYRDLLSGKEITQ